MKSQDSYEVMFPGKRRRFGHEGGVIWLTGLSGAGKSTLAKLLYEELSIRGYTCYCLDGDNLRHGLNADLGFCPKDRKENIRRVGEVAAMFAESGFICICALISPYRQDRAKARDVAFRTNFHEIHISADLTVCESRDPKGLYRKARAGELSDFTGIDAPYELPLTPELTVDTGIDTPELSVNRIVSYVTSNFYLDKK